MTVVATVMLVLASGCISADEPTIPLNEPADIQGMATVSKSFEFTGSMALEVRIKGPKNSVNASIPGGNDGDAFLALDAEDWGSTLLSTSRLAHHSIFVSSNHTEDVAIGRYGTGGGSTFSWAIIGEQLFNTTWTLVVAHGDVNGSLPGLLWLNGTDIEVVSNITMGSAFSIPPEDFARSSAVVRPVGTTQTSIFLDSSTTWRTMNGTVVNFWTSSPNPDAQYRDATLQHPNASWHIKRFHESATGFYLSDIDEDNRTLDVERIFAMSKARDWRFEVNLSANVRAYSHSLLIADIAVPQLTDDVVW